MHILNQFNTSIFILFLSLILPSYSAVLPFPYVVYGTYVTSKQFFSEGNFTVNMTLFESMSRSVFQVFGVEFMRGTPVNEKN